MRYWLVMPAAGAGRRFGSAASKLQQPLAGRTVLERALQLFVDDARCAAVALALSPAALADRGLRARLDAKILAVAGGASRCDSVQLALAALAPQAADADWVLVHDAARPCLSAADLENLLGAGLNHPLGALLATPVADTLKRADAASACELTLDRSALWQAQTPQMFRYGPLRAALEAARTAGREPTDEAQAMEWQGGRPLLVAARDANIKITRGRDLDLAAAIIAARAARAGRARQSGAATGEHA
jgi:2-C-methyl-D-erythritol 4-phosphate cytidylyltransferase